MKRLSQFEIDEEIEESIMPLPKAYTNDELNALRVAAIRKGEPLNDKEIATALGKKYVAPDPLGLRRLPNYVEVQ